MQKKILLGVGLLLFFVPYGYSYITEKSPARFSGAYIVVTREANRVLDLAQDTVDRWNIRNQVVFSPAIQRINLLIPDLIHDLNILHQNHNNQDIFGFSEAKVCES